MIAACSSARFGKSLAAILGISSLLVVEVFGASPLVSFSSKEIAIATNDFPLVVSKKAAAILMDKADAEVVSVAAGMLAEDVERVAGVKPSVETSADKVTGPAIIIGTLGKSTLIADLVQRGKVDASAIEGKWESFIIQTVADPFPGVKTALVIAGSDRRGTAYGAVTVSEAIGVSPWV